MWERGEGEREREKVWPFWLKPTDVVFIITPTQLTSRLSDPPQQRTGTPLLDFVWLLLHEEIAKVQSLNHKRASSHDMSTSSDFRELRAAKFEWRIMRHEPTPQELEFCCQILEAKLRRMKRAAVAIAAAAAESEETLPPISQRYSHAAGAAADIGGGHYFLHARILGNNPGSAAGGTARTSAA